MAVKNINKMNVNSLLRIKPDKNGRITPNPLDGISDEEIQNRRNRAILYLNGGINGGINRDDIVCGNQRENYGYSSPNGVAL